MSCRACRGSRRSHVAGENEECCLRPGCGRMIVWRPVPCLSSCHCQVTGRSGPAIRVPAGPSRPFPLARPVGVGVPHFLGGLF